MTGDIPPPLHLARSARTETVVPLDNDIEHLFNSDDVTHAKEIRCVEIKYHACDTIESWDINGKMCEFVVQRNEIAVFVFRTIGAGNNSARYQIE
jgi:hypothetical protein